jgi:uncharacterized surface protein with fasciclin (FAS1) repeats
MKSIQYTFAAFLLVFGISATPASADTVVDIALSDDNFSALVGAVSSQGLVETLESEGPFTVFAPTNQAFAEIPSYVGNLLEKNPDHLTDILLYHVVADELLAEDVLSKNRIKTVQGERLRVSANSSGAFLNQSRIVDTNFTADNGVVHVIDRVLIPNKIYQAVINDIRAQIQELRAAIGDVREDRRTDRRGH